ncbi:Ig-like domain-containing protein, partial [Streptomyces griseiscabiei]
MGVPYRAKRSGERERPEGWSRRGLLAALGAVPAVAVLTGCGGGATEAAAQSGGSASAGAGASAETLRATVTVTPADGTKSAAFTEPVEVTVSDGTLAGVTVTAADGTEPAGALDEARTKWTSSRNPYSGTAYTVTAEPDGGDIGTTTFTTASPAATFV